MDRPLFIPLRREWFEAFARGSKTREWRRYGGVWTERHCWPGRPVTLSLGYSGARLRGHIVDFSKRRAAGSAAAVYGRRAICAVLTIAIADQPTSSAAASGSIAGPQ